MIYKMPMLSTGNEKFTIYAYIRVKPPKYEENIEKPKGVEKEENKEEENIPKNIEANQVKIEENIEKEKSKEVN